jgi:hypothetical protein
LAHGGGSATLKDHFFYLKKKKIIPLGVAGPGGGSATLKDHFFLFKKKKLSLWGWPKPPLALNRWWPATPFLFNFINMLLFLF